MTNSKTLLGFIKPVNPKYRIPYILGVIIFLFFVYYINNRGHETYGIWFVLLQIPFVLIVSLPSLFPEKEVFQLFVQFTDTQIRFRNSYFKKPILINYSEIASIEIQPTKILIITKDRPVEILFNSMGYKPTQKIKANFEMLKKEINK